MVMIASQKIADIPAFDSVDRNKVEAMPLNVHIRRLLLVFYRLFGEFFDDLFSVSNPHPQMIVTSELDPDRQKLVDEEYLQNELFHTLTQIAYKW